MLPIRSWRIYYADGSTFTSQDGSWAEAPPFGVQAVVYYHVDDLASVTAKVDCYVYEGESEGESYKMGLWLDDEGFHRVMDLALGKVTP